jgi:tetratricopeptide (TPR) repeat protein
MPEGATAAETHAGSPALADARAPTGAPQRETKRAYLIAWGLLGWGVTLIGAAAMPFFVVLLVQEIIRGGNEIQPISMPKPLVEAGHTPEVAARRLQDAIDTLVAEGLIWGSRKLDISTHSKLPAIVVPKVDMPLPMLAASLRTVIPFLPPRATITGEVTLVERGASLLLRLDGREIFRSPDPSLEYSRADFWEEPALAVLRQISPHKAALALYDNEPERASDLIDSIIEHGKEADEDVAWAHLIRAVRYSEDAQFQKAEAEFNLVLKPARAATWTSSWLLSARSPSYAQPARAYLGWFWWMQNRPESAVTELRQAIDMDPHDPGARHALSIVLRSRGGGDEREAEAAFEAAEATFRRAIAAARDSRERANLHTSFGNALLGWESDKAFLQFEKAIKVDGRNAGAHRAYCAALHKWGRLSQAEAQCLRALDLAPRNQGAKNELEFVRQMQNDARKAIEGIGLAPKSAAYYISIGDEWHKKERFSEAADAYRRALELEPRNAAIHDRLGNALYSNNQLDRAEGSYRRAVELAPDEVVYSHNLAEALGKLGHAFHVAGRFEKAEGALRKAVELAPDRAELRRELGRPLLGMKRFEDAIVEFRKALELNPGDALAHNYLGLALRGQSPSNPAALDEYRKAIERDPKFAGPYYNLAFAWNESLVPDTTRETRIVRLTEACHLLEDGIRQVPNEPRLSQLKATIVLNLQTAMDQGLPAPLGCPARR